MEDRPRTRKRQTGAGAARARPPAPGRRSKAGGEGLTVAVPELLVGGSDLDFRDFVADLFAAASGMQSLRRSLGKAAGLSGSDVAVLLAIRRLSRQDCVSVREIAEHLHVAAPHVTTELGQLAAAGLITKQANQRDPRAVDVKLTPLGRRSLALLTRLVRRVNDVLFAGMSESEMQQVHHFFRRIIARSAQAAERIAA
jgi:DNA-binding MarR family transcriptional regulator